MSKFFKTYQYQIVVFVLTTLAIVLCLEIARDIFREGDFGGYISAGKLAWNGEHIYSDFRNTWPPLFSIFSIPLYWVDSLSSVGLRLGWLLGILAAYLYIFKWTINRFTSKSLAFQLKSDANSLGLTSPIFFIPFLLTFRILLEEVSNIQINVFILATSIFILDRIENKKHLTAGLLLALIISIKVYPLLLLAFVLYKKEIKTSLFTLLGLGIGVSTVLLFFGPSNGLNLFADWNNTQVVNGLKCEFMNQSLWGLMCGLLTDNSRIDAFQFNILHLTTSQMKMLLASLIGVAGVFIAKRFYDTKSKPNAFAIQFIIILSFIPILSPLAWKYYFVFLAPLCIILFHQLKGTRQLKFLLIPMLIITFTSELFVGNYMSDITEALGFITLSSLFISLISIHYLLPKSS